MKVSYLRVSSSTQSIERQKEDIIKYHPDIEFFFEETGSGVKERPVLDELISQLRFGDILVVESFSRLSRNTKDLLEKLEYFKEKKITLISVKESTLTDPEVKPTAASTLMVTLMAALSQFELENLHERQNTGMEILKKRGPVKRKPRVPDGDPSLELAIKMYVENKHSVREICDSTKVTRPTLYKKLRERSIELKAK